ncbi:hypothetical protein M0811_07640 [Anaeramoeba ignava]|uniref:Uncharacterized protein n=1 Tax=Anaeramoeba ignava TaxID=1746090 RepID=A0A9Q0RC38_ANAIG|nr:hypothetical protein M0811_07640 [Anaeramoeba ignava]
MYRLIIEVFQHQSVIHFNKLNLSLITVSVLKKIIFNTSFLKWPGFVEFDDLNSKILTYCSQKLEYKIWNLKNYQCLYILNDAKIQEVKSRLNYIIDFPKNNRYKVKLIEIESGKCKLKRKMESKILLFLLLEFWNRKLN